MKRTAFTFVVAALVAGVSGAAMAHTSISIGVGLLPGVAVAPAPVYYEPEPAYVAPPPVYVQPPVVYRSGVVYAPYAAPPSWYWRHHHGRDGQHGEDNNNDD